MVIRHIRDCQMHFAVSNFCQNLYYSVSFKESHSGPCIDIFFRCLLMSAEDDVEKLTITYIFADDYCCASCVTISIPTKTFLLVSAVVCMECLEMYKLPC